MDSDILSLQLQLSELREMVAKKESEKVDISGQLINSSRVILTLEDVHAHKLLPQSAAEPTSQGRV